MVIQALQFNLNILEYFIFFGFILGPKKVLQIIFKRTKVLIFIATSMYRYSLANRTTE
jgi:hypothetical protein